MASSASDLYESPLREGETRILTVLPGLPSSPVFCTLSRACLHDNPTYDALSYVWGSQSDSRHVNIGDARVSVTANLDSALRHLRSAAQPMKLWIDALCINQNDHEERSAQVSMMGIIYSAARSVFLYIGAADELSEAALSAMPVVAEDKADRNVMRDASTFYMNLHHRPWFQRIWILQELSLAREEPIVVCSESRISWSTFISAWNVLARHIFTDIGMTRQISEDNVDKIQVVAKVKIDVLDELRSAVHRDKGQSLRHLLIQARTSECTDVKDRIYGLLGMLNVEDRASYPAVDYRKSVATIYSEAVAHLFSKGQGPSFLSGMWLSSSTTRFPDLPSWSLDFSSQTARKAKGPCCIAFHPPHPYSVSGVGVDAVNGTVLSDQITLQVEALPVDLVGEIIYMSDDFGQCVRQLNAVCKLAETARIKTIDGETHAAQRINTIKRSEPIWRTLVSNKKYNSGYAAAPDDYEAMFADLLTYAHNLPQSSNEAAELPLPESEYVQILRSALPGRAVFATLKGFVGLASSDVRCGDEVTIWFGATIPFVVRALESTEAYRRLVSGAYVGGIMRGEMVDQMYCEDLLDAKTLLVR